MPLSTSVKHQSLLTIETLSSIPMLVDLANLVGSLDSPKTRKDIFSLKKVSAYALVTVKLSIFMPTHLKIKKDGLKFLARPSAGSRTNAGGATWLYLRKQKKKLKKRRFRQRRLVLGQRRYKCVRYHRCQHNQDLIHYHSLLHLLDRIDDSLLRTYIDS